MIIVVLVTVLFLLLTTFRLSSSFPGIVIKYDNMSYRTAVHHAHLVLGLYGKSSKYVRDLFEFPDVS